MGNIPVKLGYNCPSGIRRSNHLKSIVDAHGTQ